MTYKSDRTGQQCGQSYQLRVFCNLANKRLHDCFFLSVCSLLLSGDEERESAEE